MPTTTISYTLTISNRKQMRDDVIYFKMNSREPEPASKLLNIFMKLKVLILINTNTKFNFAALLN